MQKTSIYIDTDIGTDVDDALAIAFAAKCQQIKLAGVGTVSGNASLRANIAANILGAAGCSTTKVAVGENSENTMVGHEGKGFIDWQGEKANIVEINAADFLIKTINNSTEPISIVGIGPLTNIAKTFTNHPEIKHKIANLILMGGSIYPEELLKLNQISIPELYIRRFETNFNTDIAAAKIVLESELPITIVPIEITAQTFFTDEDIQILRASENPLNKMLTSGIDIWLPIFKEIIGRVGMPQTLAKPYLHDPLTVAVITNPELFTFKSMHISLSIQNGVLCTLIDLEKEPNMKVVTSVNVPAFRKILLDSLTA